MISGDDDWITPLAQGGARLHAAIPNARLAVIEQTGHYPFLEDTKQTLDVIGQWLSHINI